MKHLRLLALMLATMLLFTALPVSAMAWPSEAEQQKLVIDYFTSPDSDSKPMARMWFPDAGAGADDDDLIEKQIIELAEKGFGGVEVAMLADGVQYSNAEGKEYGWGTENWSKLLKKVLKAAAKVPGGFQVDMTITAHWPPSLNTLDPNDDAASKQLSYSVTPITAADLESGAVKLALPEQKVDGSAGGFGGKSAYEHFLFMDSFVSATLAQVSEIQIISGENGAADSQMYVYDFNSLQPVTDSVSVDPDGGYAAGVPDRATCDAYGWDYAEVCEFFGPESDGPWTSENGKQDDERNRKRMADWQDEYIVSLDGVAIEAGSDTEIEVGDWVVLGVFSRGTGQSIPGGRIMHNGVFITSYFNEAGTAAVTDYWDEMLANDPELLELMQANPGYIFEDSIESSSTASYWAAGLYDEFSDNYAYKGILPLVAASKYTGSGFGGSTLNQFFAFSGDDGLADKIYEDYNEKLAELYIRYRVDGVRTWAHETLGWGFRGQTYHLPGLEISRAAMDTDVAESDNMSKGDGVRYQAGTVNVTGRDFLTMEAITGPTIGFAAMDDVRTELGQNYSDGVSRAILHGTPYAKTFNGYNSDWPGWLPFGASSFGSAYTYRQTYWDDIATDTAYMARVQAVVQNGVAQIDLGVLIDREETYDFTAGNRFQNLLDLGYSYNLLSESTICHENAFAADGRIAPDGPAYKSLIVDHVNVLSVDAMNRVLEYAEAGVLIVLYGSDVQRAYGSSAENDAAVAKDYAKLVGMDGVRTAENVEEVRSALSELGVLPYASYETAQLETTMYKDAADGTRYYYMFNNAYPENSGMMGNNQGAYYKGADKAIFDAEITLNGEGVPYHLDTQTGEVTEVAAYTDNGDGTVSFTIDQLYGGDSVIYAVTPTGDGFPEVGTHVISVDRDADTFEIVRDATGLTLRSSTAGSYNVTLSDGEEIALEVAQALDVLDLTEADWKLVIHSYAPDAQSNDPSDSMITDVDMGVQKLGKWRNIAVSSEQLAAFGVDDMRNVSGVGEYTLTFDVPDTWDERTGAYLDLSYGIDQIGSITVNGTTISANNASDRVDLGTLLVSGENTITVKLDTTLYGRLYVENSGYANADFGMGGGFMQPADPDAYYNGLLSAVLVPYTQVAIQ